MLKNDPLALAVLTVIVYVHNCNSQSLMLNKVDLPNMFVKISILHTFLIFSYILLAPGQCRKDLNYLYDIDASTYLDQSLQLRGVYTGVHGQEVQFFCQNGQLLGTLMWLFQRAEHGRSNDEVKHHQEEDG